MIEIFQHTFDTILKNNNYNEDTKLKIMKECMEHDINIHKNVKKIFESAIGCRYRKIINYLFEIIDSKYIDKSVMWNSLAFEDLETTEKLLELGISIPRLKTTFSIDTYKLLEKYGVDLLKNDDLFYRACISDRNELVEYLISIGAGCIKLGDRFANIFNYDGNYKIKKLLLDNYGYIDGSIENAFSRCDYDDCELLLDYGAIFNPNNLNCENDDPDKIKRIVNLFISRGYYNSEWENDQ